jgi:glycosyltransferase involved in cell wall biosynthesis
MKVLFVCSGNKNFGKPGVVVQNQANTLEKEGVEIDFFLITKKGFIGYFKTIRSLIVKLKQSQYKVIHSHYSLSSFVATMAIMFLNKKHFIHIVSLMGSDAQMKGWKKKLTLYFNNKYWNYTIVKSEEMARVLGLKSFIVLPNGVDLESIKPNLNGSNNSIRKILFAANPDRESKGYPLAKAAFKLLNDDSIELEVKFNVAHREIIQSINACDVVLLTSKWEGSPNIIKEAMACNRPIVATKVGDVPWLLAGVEGCYLVDQDEQQVAKAIQEALKLKQSQGRNKINELNLSAKQIAQKIITLYNQN